MCTTIEKFENAIDLKHTIFISDETLKNFSSDELDQVARKILYYFPFGTENFENAKGLQDRIELHRKVYLEIAKAKEFSLQNIPSVKCLMEKGSFYGGKQWMDVVDFLKKNAIASMDNVYSFPEFYPQVSAQKGLRDEKDVNAESLMKYIDGSGDIEFQNYARFLRKKIAYFQKKGHNIVPVTWLQAVQQWGNKGGNFPSDFNDRVRKLPFGVVPHSFCVRNGKSDISFRDFVYEQTAIAFENMIGLQLPDSHRKDLMSFMPDEQTRRALVFCSAYPDQLEGKKLIGTSKACKYLNLAIKLRWLKAQDVSTELVKELLGLGIQALNEEEFSNFQNNILYIRDFSKEFLALAVTEKQHFLLKKMPRFPKKGITERIESIRKTEEFMRQDIFQGPFGTFLVLCKLAASLNNESLLVSYISKMKEVQKFVGNRLEKDLVATFFFCDLSLDEFDKMFAVLIDERKKLIEFFKKNQAEKIPYDVRDRILTAISTFVKSYSSENCNTRTSYSSLVFHVESGIGCKAPDRITKLIALGSDAGKDHCFVPLRKVDEEQRMVCAGWRESESNCPILDLLFLHIEDFRSSGFSVPFSTPLPNNPKLYKYLGKLAKSHLAEFWEFSLPEIPEEFKSLQPEMDEWVLKLKSHVRLAIWELTTGTSFESKEGAFSIIPEENRNFTVQNGFSGKDLSQKTSISCGEGKPLEKGVRWSASAKGITLNVVYPKEWIKTDEQQEKVLNWQLAWLTALVGNSDKHVVE